LNAGPFQPGAPPNEEGLIRDLGVRAERGAAVLLSVDRYEQSDEELQLLKALARGEREIQAGKDSSLDSALREADRLLEPT